MSTSIVVTGVLLSASLASAQQLITTVFGPTVGGQTGYIVAPAGDMDGDNVPDFLVSSPSLGTGLVQIISGATRTARNIVNPMPGSWAANTFISTNDMNGDGVRDIVVDRSNNFVAYSGANGAFLWDTSGIGMTFQHVASIGDINQDGRSDLAVTTTNGGSFLRLLSGSNGTLIPGFQPVGAGTLGLLAIGDITNDGHSEVVRVGGGLEIFSVAPMNLVRTLPASSVTEIAVANMSGDSKLEVLGRSGNNIHVFDTTTGTLMRTFAGEWESGRFAVLGDLNGDGVPDLAWFQTTGNPGGAIDFRSGNTGAMLGRWLGRPGFTCQFPAAVGDVNGDGYGDLLIGDRDATAVPGTPSTGGWQLVSSKILATMTYIPVQCAQGPWFPQLGITRPVLGQTCTIEGRDSPAGTSGVLALSLQPAFPTSFGVVGCDAWWDVSNWAMLHNPSGTTWQFQVPIPNVPQLAGWAIALQAFYLPTASPIGFDLSNAVWARLGF